MPRIVTATALTASAPSCRGGGVGCAEHGGGLMAEPDELLAREAERWRDGPPGDAEPGSEVYDLWLLTGNLAVALRAALAARPEREEALAVVVEIAFDWAGEYGFGSPTAARRVWEAARLLRPDLEPKAPEAPSGSATPTGDDDE